MTMTTVFGVIAIRVVMQKWSESIRRDLYPYEGEMKRVEVGNLGSAEIGEHRRKRAADGVMLSSLFD